MNFTEIIVAVLGLLGSVGIAWFAFKRGSRADDAAQENAEHAQIFGGYGSLLKSIQEDNAELRARLDEAEKRFEQRLLKAEKELASCKAEMDAKIKVLEAHILAKEQK